MDLSTCLLLCMILWFSRSYGNDEDGKLDWNSNHQSQMRRSVFSNDDRSLTGQFISRIFPSARSNLNEHHRLTKDLSRFFCQLDDDCKRISSAHVCVYIPPISKGLCLQKIIKSTGTTAGCNQTLIFFLLIVFTTISLFRSNQCIFCAVEIFSYNT